MSVSACAYTPILSLTFDMTFLFTILSRSLPEATHDSECESYSCFDKSDQISYCEVSEDSPFQASEDEVRDNLDGEEAAHAEHTSDAPT